MKKIHLKDEKGSITVFVVAIMVVTVTILAISYMGVLNRLVSEEKEIDKIQKSYSANNVDQEYEKAIERLQ